MRAKLTPVKASVAAPLNATRDAARVVAQSSGFPWRLRLLVQILFRPLLIEMSALGLSLGRFVMQVVLGALSFGQVAGAGGCFPGWPLAPALLRPHRADDRQYREERAF